MEKFICRFVWDDQGEDILVSVTMDNQNDLYKIYDASSHRHLLDIYLNSDGDWSEIMDGTTELAVALGNLIEEYRQHQL